MIGDRSVVSPGVHLHGGVRLEDEVLIGSNVAFDATRGVEGGTIVRSRAAVAANSTVLDGVEIGEGAVVTAGSVVTRTVPRHAIVSGNPARIVGYVEAGEPAPASLDGGETSVAIGNVESRVRGVAVMNFPVMEDLRGSLTAGEFSRFVPFVPKRFFMVYDVPGQEVRGEHAHVDCHQFLMCVSGSIRVLADDGERRQEFLLDRPNVGIHLPPMTWGTQYGYSTGAVLLVFASHGYDPDDYIRTYDEFLRRRGTHLQG